MKPHMFRSVAAVLAAACLVAVFAVAGPLSQAPGPLGSVPDAGQSGDARSQGDASGAEPARAGAQSDGASASQQALDAAVADAAAADAPDGPYARLQRNLAAQEGSPSYDGFVVQLKDGLSADERSAVDAAVAAGTLAPIEFAEGAYAASDLAALKGALGDGAIDYVEPDFEVHMLEGGEGDAPDAVGGALAAQGVSAAQGALAASDALAAGETAEPTVAPASAIAPNDKYYATNQYNLVDLNVVPVWEYGIEGQDFDDSVDMDGNGSADDDDIVVAVIDSGLKDGHEDIDWDRVVAGRSFADGTDSDDTNDTDGHGTFVTGIIAATKDNEVGTAGILQRAKVMPIRVFNGESASDSIIVSAINYAAQQREAFDESGGTQGVNIAVINMSLGSSGTSASMQTACQRAIADGIVIVCAAGNDGDATASYPAQYSMGVGSTNDSQTVSSYSQRLAKSNGTTYANKVWVTAPGEAVTSLYCESTKSYAQMSGTSFSSPEVAALAAVCKSLDNGITQGEFMQLLKDTAVPRTGSVGQIEGQDVEYGWGTVDFKRTADKLIGQQFGDQTGESRLTVRVQNEAGSEIDGAFASIYELATDAAGNESRGAEIEPGDDGAWTLQKGHRYFYAAHAEKYDYQEGTFATLTDARTLTITLLGKSYPVTLSFENTSGEAVAADSVSVRSMAGKAFSADGDGVFMLRNGTYSYEVEAAGYFDTSGSFVVDDVANDLDDGMAVPVFLRGDRDVCSLRLRIMGDSEDGDVSAKATVVLLDADGAEVEPYKDGCYKLDAGTYAYTAYHDEYKPVSGTVEVTADDIGTSQVLTANLNGKLYTVTFHVFPLGSTPDMQVYDSAGESCERQRSARADDYRNYRVTDGTYYFRIADADAGTYTGTFTVSDGKVATRGLSINVGSTSRVIMQLAGTREIRVNLQKGSGSALFDDGTLPPALADIVPPEPEQPAHVHKYVGVVTREATCTQEGEMTWTCIDGDDSYAEALPKLAHQFDDERICTVCGIDEADTVEDEDWLHLKMTDRDGNTTVRNVSLTQLAQYQQVKSYTQLTYYGTSVSFTVYGIPFQTLIDHYVGASKCVSGMHITAMDIAENRDSDGTLYSVDLDRAQLDNAMIAWYTVNNSTGEERTGSEENNMRVVIDNGRNTDWMYGPDVLEIAYGEHEHEAGQVVAPTCTEDGYTEYTCSICGNSYHADIVPATGHVFDAARDVVTEPTCEHKGYTTHVCEVCGETVVDTYTVCPHDLEAVEGVAATADADGFEAYWRCKDCGRLFSDAEGRNEIAAPIAIPKTGGGSGDGGGSGAGDGPGSGSGASAATAKAAAPLSVSAKSLKAKAAKLKKKAATFKAAKAFKVSGAAGKVTYKKLSGSKKVTVSAAGKVKVKKKAKKGTYKVRVRVSCAGDARYGAASRTVTLKAKVK